MAVSLSGCGAAVADSITPTDPGLSPAERERLTPQCLAVLNCLRRGPAWNYELATIGLSYTRRLSDLRAHNHQVDIIQNGDHGARLYGLVITCPTCKGGDLVRCDHCNDVGSLLVAREPVPGCGLRTIHPEAMPC
jgi:hypothetical protein